MRKALILLAFLTVPFSVATGQDNGTVPFFKERETGWFWRREPNREKKTEKRKIVKKEKPKQKTKKSNINEEALKLLKLPRIITEKDLDKLTPSQIGKLYNLYVERALYAPNEQDYKNIFTIQNYIIKKSMLYTIAMQETLRKNPQWNPQVTRPISKVGRNTIYIMEKQDMRRLFKKYKDKAGLYFFFESNCPYCLRQASILKLFQKEYGWSVLPISVDGKCIAGYENCEADTGDLAGRLNIKYFPAIYLVIFRNGRKPLMQPISFGLVTEDKLEKTIYNVLYFLEHKTPRFISKKVWSEIKKEPDLTKKKIQMPKKLEGIENILNNRKEESNFEKFLWE